jgi:hypothetical protein
VATPEFGSVQCVVLDCPDPAALAGFYRAILGGVVNRADARWSTSPAYTTLHTAAGLVLAFQRVPGYQSPRWPDPEAARETATRQGATLLRSDGRGWLILADPAGHPFCLLPGRRPPA